MSRGGCYAAIFYFSSKMSFVGNGLSQVFKVFDFLYGLLIVGSTFEVLAVTKCSVFFIETFRPYSFAVFHNLVDWLEQLA